jgi:glycosyltransferase involved in cell wall biosynthesis
MPELSDKTLSIVVPVYNEEKTIQRVLDRLQCTQSKFGVSKQIIIVNDCSTDNTRTLVERYMDNNRTMDIQLVNHEVNGGKGAALRTGIGHATGDYLIVQDADLEYDPSEYDRLLALLISDTADVVYGSRFMGGSAHRVLFFWHSIGNKILTTLSNAFTNLNLTDMETGYKMFRRKIIQSIDLKENRFGFEPEVTAKVARIQGIRIYEVGISYYGRTYSEGKKINWKDGFRALYCILRYNLFK